LSVETAHDATRVGIKLQEGVGIPDISDDTSNEVLEIKSGLARHLPGYHYETGGHECFDGNARRRILTDHLVKQRVGNLIGHLIGVALRNGFRSKQIGHPLR
jgi:hypothetical protein